MNASLLRCAACLLVATAPHALSQPTPADSLTVQDAVALVLARNPSIQEAEQTADAATARIVQSRAPLLPSADLLASYTYLAPISELSLGGIDFKVFPANNYDGHIGVRQLLFDFQKSGSAVDVSASRATVAQDALVQVKRDLSFRIAGTFYTILFLHRSIDVKDEQIRTLNEHLLTTKNRIASGTATQLDALTTEVRVAAAQTQRINLESELHRQEIAFRTLASLPPGSPLKLKGEFSRDTVMLNEETLMKTALAGRIENRTSADEIEAAQMQQKAAGLHDMPALTAIAAYGVKNGYIPNLDVWRGNVVAGVELSFPLFDGNRGSGMEQEATANLHAAEARQRAVALSIQSDVQQAVSDVRATMEQLQVSEIGIAQATLALETARLRYDAGTVANLDLLDAESALSEARLVHLQALRDYVIDCLQLRRATGEPALGQ